MDVNEYRKRGKEMVDYVANYLENIRERRVFPDVKPGYMRTMLPDSAPLDGENWQHIIDDVERVIMPGITHWQSPHMHAYFPALNSFPSLLGDMLADAINCLGFTWASSPACTELETIVMNWLGKMIGLPDEFLHSSSNSGGGGGVIQTTSSESTLICLLAGRTQAIQRFHEITPGFQDAEINARLVAYCSDQAHSSVEKAALIGLVRMRYIESDAKLSLRGQPLRDAIDEDIKAGLVPFWVCATLGTTGACAFDHLEEIGAVCHEYKLWLHVDAAYAGSAFLCPEHRIWLKGIDKCDSIAFNPSKWLMVHFDCTAMWVKNSTALHRTFNVEPLYLQHENSGLAIDYMHWQIPLSKRFRSLKLWFVIRSYGIKGLQKHIRESVRLAQKFEAIVLADTRFEIPAQRHLGLVVFRLKGENELTEKLLKRLNHRGNIHCVPSSLKGKYVIRFTVTSTHTTNDDILKDWSEIRHVATEVINELNVKTSERARVPLKEIREKNEAFGSSLLLANCPMSPKVVNGSFAAIFDADEFLAKAYSGIRIASQDSPAMRRRVRGILMSGKQFSLDSRMDLVVQGIGTSESNGVEKTRAIEEDCEDSWEVCENSRIIDKIQETNQLHPINAYNKFLQPIQLPNTKTRCHHKIKLTKKRSLSMDEIVCGYDKLKFNRIFNDDNIDYCYTDHKIFNTNLHFIHNKNFYEMALKSAGGGSSSLLHADNLYASKAQLNSINEELLEEHENDKMLIEFHPNKRQSEPNVCYSFLNYGFEMNNHLANQQFTVPELILNPAGTSNRKKWLTRERQLDDYYSIDKDLEAALNSPLTANIYPEYEIADSADDDDDEYDEGTIYENIKFCRKCGHKSLKFQ